MECMYTQKPLDEETAVAIYGYTSAGELEIKGYADPEIVGEHAYKCEECNRYFEEEDILTVPTRLGSRTVCAECATPDNGYYTCQDCGEIFFENYGGYIDNDYHAVCNECFDRYEYNICESCGQIIASDETCWEDDTCLCPSCYDSRQEERKDFIHNYSYKPMPIFYQMDDEESEKLYMGVELEIDNGNVSTGSKALHDLDENEFYFYQKHDASLGFNGIEIVTHPCTLKYHMEKFPWDKIMETALDNGYRSHETSTCGLHVHISRAAFGDTTFQRELNIAKVLLLFDRFFEPQIIKFSRRKNMDWVNRYAKKLDSPMFYSDDEADDLCRKQREYRRLNSGCDGDRHTAVNLGNDATVEFRVFQGTLKKDTLFATLQFLSNVVYFVTHTNLADIQEADWLKFANSIHYRELDEYLEAKELNVSATAKKIVAPRIRKMRVKHGVRLFVDGRLNPEALEFEKDTVRFNPKTRHMSFVEFKDNKPNDLIVNADVVSTGSGIHVWHMKGDMMTNWDHLAIIDLEDVECLKWKNDMIRNYYVGDSGAWMLINNVLKFVRFLQIGESNSALLFNFTDDYTLEWYLPEDVTPITFPLVMKKEDGSRIILKQDRYGTLFDEETRDVVSGYTLKSLVMIPKEDQEAELLDLRTRRTYKHFA